MYVICLTLIRAMRKVFKVECSRFQSHVSLFSLRIDNGDLERICTRLRIFSDILVINQSIRTQYISNESWISQLLNGMNYIIVSKGVQNICTKALLFFQCG